MAKTESGKRILVDIRPDVSVYATYRRLSYTPWHAVAEFVDNSTQNYFNHKQELLKVYKREGEPGKLRVEVDYDHDGDKLTVRDNANGMNAEELERAVRLDKPPPMREGRCEFGMGLKTAACWFGASWTIRTTRLGSKKELSITVDIPELVEKHPEKLAIHESPDKAESHFTGIVIRGLYKPIMGRTSGRIHDQLGSMYREDLRSKEIEILWNGKPVTYKEPELLVEEEDGESTEWRKKISLDVPWDHARKKLKAKGWVGIQNPGSQKLAGFALLRRGRVVVGGPDAGYKPRDIFGEGNSFRSQRLVGELHMDEWPVTQAKDAFDWSGGLEDAFIDELNKACQEYGKKAEGYREREKPVTRADMELASAPTREMFSSARFAAGVTEELKFPEPRPSPQQQVRDAEKLRKVSTGPVSYRLKVGTEEWVFNLHWQDKLSDTNWMSVSYPQDDQIEIFLNMAHPFFTEYMGRPGFLEILTRFVMSLALAEKISLMTSRQGLVSPEDFRMHMNRVLKWSSSIEESTIG